MVKPAMANASDGKSSEKDIPLRGPTPQAMHGLKINDKGWVDWTKAKGFLWKGSPLDPRRSGW